MRSISFRRLTLTTLVSFCALAGVLALSAAPALAARAHVFGGAFGWGVLNGANELQVCTTSCLPGLAGSGEGQFGSGEGRIAKPAGVAINEATGDVYVVDEDNNRVEWFNSTGSKFEGQITGSSAAGTGALVNGSTTIESIATTTGAFSVGQEISGVGIPTRTTITAVNGLGSLEISQPATASGSATLTAQEHFEFPEDIAIDNDAGSPSFGDVYVVDTGHYAIDKFSSSGSYLGQIAETSPGSTFYGFNGTLMGVAVDSKGTVWVYQEKERGFLSERDEIDSFSNALDNVFITSFDDGISYAEPEFAVDSDDNLYVKSAFRGISKINSSGEVQIGEFDSLLHEPNESEALSGVAVDLSNNDVYIGDADNANSIGLFTPTGSLIEEFGSEHLTRSRGIAVNSSTHTVYVADAATDEVDIFPLTRPAKPTVVGESVSEVRDRSAILSGQVNLNTEASEPATTAYFQYGTVSCEANPSACEDVPSAPGTTLGSGFEEKSIGDEPIQNLLPGTVYHYRVVAENAYGVTYGPEAAFTTQTSGAEFALPDGRVWELVSPPDKHGGVIQPISEDNGVVQAAEDGDAITYAAVQPIDANPRGNLLYETQEISTRDDGGWSSRDLAPPNETVTGNLTGYGPPYRFFSADLSLGLLEPLGEAPLNPEATERTIYLRSDDCENEQTCKEAGQKLNRPLVTAGNVPPGAKFGRGPEYQPGRFGQGVTFLGAAPDLTHVVLSSIAPLTNGAGERALYEWVGGQLLGVSVLPGSQVPAGGGRLGNGSDVRDAISSDGSRIVWELGGKLYLRDITKGETVELGGGSFQTANSEDSRVFFTEGGELDVFTTAGGDGPLSGSVTNVTEGKNAEVQGVVPGASEDGDYVYFVARGVLSTAENKEQEKALAGQDNLYLAHYDSETGKWATTFIAVLSKEDDPDWGGIANPLGGLTSRVSPNGGYLAFMSDRPLTGYDNDDANSGVLDEEVFLYDASSERVICASCNPTGAQPAGMFDSGEPPRPLIDRPNIWAHRWLAGSIPGWTPLSITNALYQSRYLSNSGRLFFDSADGLVPQDVNGTEDVYEYEPDGVGGCQGSTHGQSASDVFSESAGGCVALISAGASSEESAFLDASASGEDVFFLTSSQLVPQDVDTAFDVYDAHVCSVAAPCSTAPVSPPPCSTADSCRAAPSPQPAIFGAPSSATFSGAGNLGQVASKPAATTRTLTRAQRLANALRACQRKVKREARALCKSRAKKKYGSQSKAKKSTASRKRGK